jgi:hypothetical protein
VDAVSEWNFLVRISADDPSATKAPGIYQALVAAAEALKSSTINVLVELVTVTPPATKAGAERTLIMNGVATKTTVPPPVNTGDPASLIAFRDWAKQFPAKKTALIIYGHGDGIEDWHEPQDLVLPDPVQRIAPAQSFLDALTVPELGKAVRGDPAIHLIGLDACLMGMAEVAYEIRSAGQVVVASELEDAAEGWPYPAILQELSKNVTMSAAELAHVIVDRYEKAAPSPPRVIAGVRLDAMAEVAKQWKALLPQLQQLQQANRSGVEAARNSVPDCMHRPYYDVRSLLAALSPLGLPVANAIAAIDKATLEVRSLGAGSTYHGMSLYFPNTASDKKTIPAYRKIAFATDTGWADFLQTWLAPL